MTDPKGLMRDQQGRLVESARIKPTQPRCRGAGCFSRSSRLHVLHGDDEPPLIDLDLHRRTDVESRLLEPIALEIEPGDRSGRAAVLEVVAGMSGADLEPAGGGGGRMSRSHDQLLVSWWR